MCRDSGRGDSKEKETKEVYERTATHCNTLSKENETKEVHERN